MLAILTFQKTATDSVNHDQAEFREANFFPVEIFSSPNRVSDSVSDADSRDIKISMGFAGNPILEISIKIRNWVDSHYMRGRINMKVGLIAIFNCPVILVYF